MKSSKKEYIKPYIHIVEMESLLNNITVSSGFGNADEEFMSKGNSGFEDFGEFESLDTDTYSAANWRQNNLWDTNLWD